MCDQRERLIGYLYEEGDPAERAEVQSHLGECAVCREEIAGFRSVQEDLREWEVPEHESVWRPFAAPQPTPWWQQVPRWAMAAAAGLVLMSGATGGAVAYFMTPAPQHLVQQAPPAILQNTSSVTADDLAAAEARVLDRVRTEFAAFQSQVPAGADRVLTVSNTGLPGDEARLRQLEQQVADLLLKTDEQFGIASGIRANLQLHKTALDTKYAAMEAKLKNALELVYTSR